MASVASDEIVISGGDLRVSKRLDRERFKHLGVVYDISSNRATPVTLRITDPVPSSVPLGFHPKYCGSAWSMGEHEAVFERELAPGEQLTTLYGLGTMQNEPVEAFQTEPTVEIKPPGADRFERVTADPTPGEGTQQDSVSSFNSTSIADLASAVETFDDSHRPSEPHPLEDSSQVRSGGPVSGSEERFDLRSAFGESVRELQSLQKSLPGEDPQAHFQSRNQLRTVRYHLDSIRFHLFHLRHALSGSRSMMDGETEPHSGPGERDRSSVAARTRNGSDDSLVGVFRPGAGLPLFWIVSLLGLWTSLAGFGLLGSPGAQLVLAGLGGFVAVFGAIGWLYPEEKLPLPALPIAVGLAGLAILVHPFLFGSPRTATGFVTIASGVLITMIPVAVENRRWQLLGLLKS